jgi:formamidopyrimidine-DNA glycosylase
MPELPEMETYKNQLLQLIGGKTISDVEVNRAKSVNLPAGEFKKQVANQSVLDLGRYGKALFFRLSSGQRLFLHLMLGGRLYFGTKEDAPDHTKQVILTFGQASLFFIGLRLGYLHLISPDEFEHHIKGLGPDALNSHLTVEGLTKKIRGKRSPIKTVLTDQKFIAGIGNRYSDEICFAAGCDPRKKGFEFTEDEGSRTFKAIQQVLQEAIQFGGYMDTPLFKDDQLTGSFASKMKVHGRAGEPCQHCGTTIKMVEISSKKTCYCPVCQK